MIQRYCPEAEQIKHSELCVPIPEILFETKEKVF
jgi:hypothetical protein